MAQQDAASIVDEWARSAHGDATAEAFTHWDDEGAIPPTCALCHAGAGFRDYYGFDGSAAGEIAGPVQTGGVIDCDTCHVDGAADIAEVTFPSGVTLPAPAANGPCYTCHQGRQSGPGVAAAVSGMDPDTVNPELTFLNPHYAAAAATLFGSDAKGPFEYDGRSYAGKSPHVPTAATCTDCHSPHSLQVDTASCAGCHETEITTDIRLSAADHDGDGDTTEGIAGEIATLHDRLGNAIMAYAKDVAGAAVVYDAATYPYFFADTDADGMVDEGEAVYPNRYARWTPRLLQAAYNYQFVAKDPGAYAHNARYVLQVLLDSLDDLGARPAAAIRPE